MVYTLHYFNAKGRGEAIRWMFKARGIEFVDKRYSFEEFQDQFKSST